MESTPLGLEYVQWKRLFLKARRQGLERHKTWKAKRKHLKIAVRAKLRLIAKCAAHRVKNET